MTTLPPSTNRPVRTLYVNNLETKINKVDSKRLLYTFFTQFGSVLDVVVSRHPKHRGQAYVSFRDLSASSMALRAGQGFPLGGKPIRIAYAKRDSDRVNEYLGIGNELTRKKQKQTKKPRDDKEESASIKKAKKQIAKQAEAESERTEETLMGDPENPPNHIIFLENLPSDSTEEMVEVLFNQFDGYKETRMIPSRPDLAFVEFDSAAEAQKAQKALDRFSVTPTNVLKITFARM